MRHSPIGLGRGDAVLNVERGGVRGKPTATADGDRGIDSASGRGPLTAPAAIDATGNSPDPVFLYFGYGSNLHLPALRAKGVVPLRSTRGTLPGWRLAFNVRHFFRHEGGMGNIVPSAVDGDEVQGVVHVCDDDALDKLDALEARGIGYDRIEVEVDTDAGPVLAQAYVGRPEFLDDGCLPTRRYRAILLKGAVAAGLDEAYIRRLAAHPLAPETDLPPWEPPTDAVPTFTRESLARHPELTALAGAVFDMSHAHPRLAGVTPVLGARDTTLFHLHRHDASDGTETLEDLRAGLVADHARRYLNAYLHEYAAEFRFAGRLIDP